MNLFVHYFTQVPVNISVVEQRIDRLRDNLEEWANVAYREGEDLRAKVGPSVGGYAKEVRLTIGKAEIHRSGLVYPVTWTAMGAEALFPRLNADLVVSHVGLHRTKLSFEGTYQPPLGPLGRAVDRAILGRVAEATVQNWVDQVAAAVSAERQIT